MSIFIPPWLQQMPNGHAKRAAENRFYLRLAALYATESGTLVDLAWAIGVNENTLRSQASSKVRASHKTKEGIKRILGSKFEIEF